VKERERDGERRERETEKEREREKRSRGERKSFCKKKKRNVSHFLSRRFPFFFSPSPLRRANARDASPPGIPCSRIVGSKYRRATENANSSGGTLLETDAAIDG